MMFSGVISRPTHRCIPILIYGSRTLVMLFPERAELVLLANTQSLGQYTLTWPIPTHLANTNHLANTQSLGQYPLT